MLKDGIPTSSKVRETLVRIQAIEIVRHIWLLDGQLLQHSSRVLLTKIVSSIPTSLFFFFLFLKDSFIQCSILKKILEEVQLFL